PAGYECETSPRRVETQFGSTLRRRSTSWTARATAKSKEETKNGKPATCSAYHRPCLSTSTSTIAPARANNYAPSAASVFGFTDIWPQGYTGAVHKLSRRYQGA